MKLAMMSTFITARTVSRCQNFRRSRRYSALIGALALLILTLWAIPASGQNYLTQTGTPPFTTAQPVELGFINLGNGNLHLTIPLGSFPQRGSRPFTSALIYDSRIWQPVGSTWQPTNVANSQGGWRLARNTDVGSVSNSITSTVCKDPPNPGLETDYVNFTWREPDGTLHTFYGIDTWRMASICGGGTSPSGDALADDASGYHMYVTNYTHATVYAPDGTQVFPSVKDTNGNYFSTDPNGNIIDTLGRTPVTYVPNGTGCTASYCYNILNSQGSTSSQIKVTTQTINVSTNFGQSGLTEYSGTITVIQSIQLPDGTSYQFTYDSGTTAGHYGELTGITLPTLGQITYGYTNFTDAFGNHNMWVSSRVSGGGTWSYTPSVTTGCESGAQACQQVTVAKPSGDNAVYTFSLNNGAWKSQVQAYTGAISAANLVSTTASTWDFSQPCVGLGCTGASHVRILRTTTTLPTPGSNNITNKTEMTYADANTSNIASIKEWKFYAGTSPTFPPTPDRETDFTYLSTSAYTAKNILNRPLSISVKDGSGAQVALTNLSYDGGTLSSVTGVTNHDDTNFGTGNTVRGNLTQVQSWVSGTSSLSATITYDTTGQGRSSQDAAGNTTSLSYTDNFFTDNGNTPPATYTPATPTNAYITQVTPPVSGSISLGYYFNTGKPTFARDQNGNDSYNHFQDSLDRLTLALGPLLNGNRAWTLLQYTQQTQVDTYLGILDATPSSGCTRCRHDQLLLDNLGRTSQRILVSDPDGATTVTYSYDTNSRLASLSNPARSSPGPTDGTDTIGLDGIDRTTLLTHADTTVGHTYFGANVSIGGGVSSQLCSSSTYGLGYPILSVDEAGMKVQKWNDGFGRLIEVDEPDSSGSLTVGTCYSFSPLNKVTQVVQGAQTRSYTYDWLGRVTAATDPESGTTNLYYTTSSGGLCSGDPAVVCRRTDARGITITYGYDAGNRLVSKTYSDNTPAVQYGYDGTSLTGCATAPPALTISNPNGHRTAMCDGSGATAWSYDAVGHITTEKRIIQGAMQPLSISYAYNPDGSLASVTYPSNRVVSYGYSNAQRPISAIDTASGINYVQNVTYAPQGAISSALHGNVAGGFGGITESLSFNSRLETTSIKALNQTTAIMSLVPGFSLPGGNNGTVASVSNADGRDAGRNQTYTYDPLNRINTAQSQATSGPECWGQNYGYDRWANLLAMNVAQCSGYSLSVSVDSHNHITNTGFGYDLSGNMTADGLNSYSWDAENGLKSAAGVNYTYDGDRFRVTKSSGTLYWRSVAAQTLAETDSSGSTSNSQYFEYIYFAGRRVARRETSGNVLYYFSDQVGSTRVIFRSDNQTVCFDSDYTPYGTELPASGVSVTCPQNYKFTGYERDPESGLDYATFRYYNSRTGRFMSPDPLSGRPGNPQSQNRYTYVLNDPCTLIDPFGLATCTFNISVNNQAGLVGVSDLIQALIQIAMIFAQSDDGHGNSVSLNFTLGGPGDYTLEFKNGAWYNLDSRGNDGATSMPFGICCFGNSVVYVNNIRNHFGEGDSGTLALGNTGAHELFHRITGHGGHVETHVNLMNPYSNGDEWNSPSNNLTQEQISDLFQKCLKLHPPKKCDKSSGCSSGGGGGSGPAGGSPGQGEGNGPVGWAYASCGDDCGIIVFWNWPAVGSPPRRK